MRETRRLPALFQRFSAFQNTEPSNSLSPPAEPGVYQCNHSLFPCAHRIRHEVASGGNLDQRCAYSESSGMGAAAFFFGSGNSVTIASVVRRTPARDAAFCNATRTT